MKRYTSIMEGNKPAIRLLTSDLKGLPRYQEYTRYCTRSIPVRSKPKKVKKTSSFSISKCTVDDKTSIIVFLNRYGGNHQFYPNWTIDTLFHPDHTPGLKESDMLIARKQGEIVGCMAMWDQRSFRQTIIKGYHNGLSKISWLLNTYAKLFGYPMLPKCGTELKSCFISHIAIDEDDPEIFKALLVKCHNVLVNKDIEYMVIGFSDNHPLDEVVASSFRSIPVYSRLYLVSWDEDGIDPIKIVDNRIPSIEAAIL